MNKTIASVSAAVVLGGAGASAQVMPAVAEMNITTDLTFASEYVSRGIERADESFQPSLEATFGDFYVGGWANLQVTNRDLNDGRGLTELNYYGGVEILVDQWVGGSFDVGLRVYDYPGINVRNTHEAYVGTVIPLEQLPVPGVSVGVYYYYDFEVRSHVLEGSARLSHSLEEFVPNAASLELSFIYGKQFGGSQKFHGIRPHEDFHYYGFAVELPYYLTDFSYITPGVHFMTAEKIDFDVVGGRGKNLFWTISYTAGF